MYQEARRLGELVGLPGVPYHQVATLQCHSYLAATNALSLVPKDHAWLAIVAADQTDRVCHPAKVSVETIRLTRDRQGKRRRKVAYRIPERELDPNLVSAPIDVLELSDIRKDYGLALARLQLSAEFPELERTSQFARISGPCVSIPQLTLHLVSRCLRFPARRRDRRRAVLTDGQD